MIESIKNTAQQAKSFVKNVNEELSDRIAERLVKSGKTNPTVWDGYKALIQEGVSNCREAIKEDLRKGERQFEKDEKGRPILTKAARDKIMEDTMMYAMPVGRVGAAVEKAGGKALSAAAKTSFGQKVAQGAKSLGGKIKGLFSKGTKKGRINFIKEKRLLAEETICTKKAPTVCLGSEKPAALESFARDICLEIKNGPTREMLRQQGFSVGQSGLLMKDEKPYTGIIKYFNTPFSTSSGYGYVKFENGKTVKSFLHETSLGKDITRTTFHGKPDNINYDKFGYSRYTCEKQVK